MNSNLPRCKHCGDEPELKTLGRLPHEQYSYLCKKGCLRKVKRERDGEMISFQVWHITLPQAQEEWIRENKG